MSPTSRVAFGAVALLFLASRLYILFLAEIQGSTIAFVNIPYALSFRHAAREGTTFYAEIENLKHRTAAHQEFGGVPAQEVEFRVEYPPLAVEWMRFTLLLQPSAKPGDDLNEVLQEAVLISRAVTACVDLAGFVMLALLVPRLFRGEGATRQSVRLLLYTGGGMILFHLLYDRLDLPVGVLVLAALWLLVERRHWALSLAVLAVAINYKITPGVLAPIWILGAMPAAALAGPLNGERIKHLAGAALMRGLLLAGFIIALFLPFYLAWGDAALDFVEYHAKRSLQLESLWAAAVLVAARIHGPAPQILTNFGALHLESPVSHELAAISPWVTFVLLVPAGLSFWQAVRRRLTHIKPGSMTLAQAAPDLIVGYTVLFLLVSMASAKVLSPQYFVWLVPLVPLLAWNGALNRAILIGFLLMLGLTTVLFPYIYFSQIWPVDAAGQQIVSVPPPPALALAVLVARNLLLVGVTAGLWLNLRRQPQP